jgi:hypothetical protein
VDQITSLRMDISIRNPLKPIFHDICAKLVRNHSRQEHYLQLMDKKDLISIGLFIFIKALESAFEELPKIWDVLIKQHF